MSADEVKWQPISTAPMDGTRILCGCFRTARDFTQFWGHITVDEWNQVYRGFGKFNKQYWPATHWMPLPAPPALAEASNA